MGLRGQFKSGAELAGFSLTITEEVIAGYAESSGDFNPIHLEREFAAQSMFGGIVAHGMLGMALICRMFSDNFGPEWAANGEVRAQFRKPIPAGSAVAVTGAVVNSEGARVTARGECLLDDGSSAVTVTLTVNGG